MGYTIVYTDDQAKTLIAVIHAELTLELEQGYAQQSESSYDDLITYMDAQSIDYTTNWNRVFVKKTT